MKTILVNYTGRASAGANYALEMTKGFLANKVHVIAIVSSNAINIDAWRELKDIELYEIETYTSKPSFLIQSLRFLFSKRAQIRKHFRNVKIDAIYVPMETYWTRWINQIFQGVPVFFTLHDPLLHSGESFFNRIFSSITKKNVSEAEYVITLSKRFIPVIAENYGIDKAKIMHIPHGAFWEYMYKRGARRTVSYDETKINFLFFGRIEHYKGIGILVQAYQKLEEKYPDKVTLTIAGKGSLEEVQNLIGRLKYATIMNYMIPDEQVADLFDGKQVITVLPYLDATQSGVIPTAQMFDSLIIASDSGALREQLDDGEAGVMVEPGNVDALYQAMEAVGLKKVDVDKKISSGQTLVNELKWPVLAQKILNFVS